METMKQLRERLGISQIEVATQTNIPAPILCNYESGQAIPSIDDMIILERAFGGYLDWSRNEKINTNARENILNCITELSVHYPLISVLNFVQKYIKEGNRFGEPDKFIMYYTKIARETEIEAMLPTTTF